MHSNAAVATASLGVRTSADPLAGLRAPSAIGYARVSTVGQVDGTSIEHQLACIRRYCSTIELALIRTCIDPGRSGRSRANRPGLAECLRLARELRVGAVIVHRDDRLARSMADAQDIAGELQADGIALIVLEPLRIDLPHADAYASRLAPQMSQVLAEHELRQIRARTVPAIATVARAGKKFGRLVVGYVRLPDGTIALDPGSAHIREAFHKITAGAAVGEVLRWLSGCYTRPGGGRVTRDQLEDLLRNRWVLGEFRYHLPKLLPRDGGQEVVIPQHHPALVDPLLFARVQQVLDHRAELRRTARGGAPARTRRGTVHGAGDPRITRCGACGGAMYCQLMPISSGQRRTWIAKYACRTHQQFGNAVCPALPGLATEVDAVIRDAFIAAVGQGLLRDLAGTPLPDGAQAPDAAMQARIVALAATAERVVAASAAAAAAGDAAIQARLAPRLERIRTEQAAATAVARRQSATLSRPDDALTQAMQDPAATWDALGLPERRALLTRCASQITIVDRVPAVVWRTADTAAGG